MGNPPLPADITPLPKCPRCKVSILNPLRPTCSLCDFDIPLTVRDPSKAGLSEWIAEPDDSPMRLKCLRIAALRQTGMTYEEISPIMGLNVSTIRTYMCTAGANGWLKDLLTDPKERMEFEIFNKVVRRLDEALDSEAILNTGMKERTAVALKVGEGSLFNRNEQAQQQNGPSTMIAVKVEVVGGEPQKMREGTIVGASRYLDAEEVKP